MERIPYQEFLYSSYPLLCAIDLRDRVRNQQLFEQSPLLVLDRQSDRRYHPKFYREAYVTLDELVLLAFDHFYDRHSYCGHFLP